MTALSPAPPTRQDAPSRQANSPLAGLSPEALARVRPQVQRMLMRIPAYSQLTSAEQTKLAHDMVKVLAYIDDPNGVVADLSSRIGSGKPVLAAAQADANEETRQNLSKSPGFAGKDFVAGAAAQGTEQFTNLVKSVDFPAFVGGLINNVFRVIVETTIEQMHAYGELVANVAKSVEDYMSENIGEGQGRDYLAQRFPDLLDVDVDGDGKSKLRVKAEDSEAALGEIQNSMNIPGEKIEDIEDEETEKRLVNAARLMMAKSRQQLLASMVMLGINRIVVTDGSITAKVQFSMRATDEAKRAYRASAYDRQTSRNKNVSAFGGGFLGFGGGSVNVNEQSHVATVSTSNAEDSESKLDLAAKLQGEVRVNFKSDYLPLEKMATPEMIGAIQGNSKPAPPPRMASAAPPAGTAARPRRPRRPRLPGRRRQRRNAIARFAEAVATPFGLQRAVDDARNLLLAAETHAVMMAELGDIDVPPAAAVDAMQLRAIAGLYLASTLEAAGLIQAAEDFTALVRTGAIAGDLGAAAPLVDAFWRARTQRISEAERLALFGRLFGAPAGPDDAAGAANREFEELLLDLCDAIIKAADGGSQAQVRAGGTRLAENIATAANDIVQMAARDIFDSLGHAIAILNHADVRAMLMARTLWDAVTSIDRRFKRPPRPTLSHLRRGRAGMAVLAWLADAADSLERGAGALVSAGDTVIDSAIEWVDETLSLVRGEDSHSSVPSGSSVPGVAALPGNRGTGSVWRDLGR